jgi:hypothetical protein
VRVEGERRGPVSFHLDDDWLDASDDIKIALTAEGTESSEIEVRER